MKAKPAKPRLKFTALDTRNYTYLLECRSRRHDPVLDALRDRTTALGRDAVMQISHDQGSFLTLLVAAIGAREAIEIGTFTGYSSICIARGLPANGRLLCLDESKEWTDIAKEFWKRAGVEKKIEFHLAPAMESLRKLDRNRKFDFAFIDADKTGYDDYYEAILPRMRRNGLILFDNMLWHGRLVKRPIAHESGRALDRLNKKLARDPRAECVLLSVGDGINMCRVL